MSKLTKEMRADCSECGGVKRVEADSIADAKIRFVDLGWEAEGDLWWCSRCVRLHKKNVGRRGGVIK